MTWSTLTQLQDYCKNLPPSTWIVEGLLRNNVIRPNLLCGFPHVGKSTIARQLATAVSRGQHFLGRNTEQGHVVYWASEDSEQDIVSFFQKQGADSDNITVLHSDTMTLADRNTELNQCIDHLTKNTQLRLPVRLVIIETLEDFFLPQNVNDNSEMTRLLSEFRDSVIKGRNENICFVFIHHFNKNMKVEAQSNGLLKISGARAIISMTASKWMLYTEGDDQPERILYTKLRPAGRDIEPTYLKYDKDTDTVELGETVADVKKSTKSLKTVSRKIELSQQIVSTVEKNPGITVRMLRTLMGGSNHTVGKEAQELITQGVLKTIEGAKNAKHLFTSTQEITETAITGWPDMGEVSL